MTHIKDIVADVNGTTFIGVDTRTVVGLTGGKKNPHQGRITKVATGASCQVCQNKNVNGYEATIRRRLTAEGKNPNDFVLGPRTWGTRLPGMPIVEHKGRLYLELMFLSSGEVHYELDGVRIAKSDIIGLKPAAAPGAQGGVANKVVIRTFKVESLTAIRINRKEYTNIEE